VVHGLKIGLDIRLEVVVNIRLPQEVRDPPGRFMGALTDSAGVGIADHSPLEVWFQDGVQAMLDNPVTKRERYHLPRLWIVNDERPISTDFIRLPDQLIL
jgi:hypothetical protein